MVPIHGMLTFEALASPDSVFGAVSWEESTEGQHVRVTGSFASGLTIKFWIDPQKDWAVVRTAMISPNHKVQESRAEYERFGGIWYCRQISYFRSNFKDGLEPYERLEVTRAVFNEPQQPASFTPVDIGLVTGTIVEMLDENYRRRAIKVWDGSGLREQSDYAEAVAKGELKTSSVHSAALQRRREENAALLQGRLSNLTAADTNWSRVESEWERYTREFIERFKLTEEQAAQARRILSDCQDRARAFIDRRREDFEAVEKEASKVTFGEGLPLEHEREIRSRIAILMKPVDEIFESRLKPALEKLPTAAQRAAAGQPAKPGHSDKLP